MIYIMRHGRTDWNATHKLQGRTDIPLNEEGREMARNAHEEYKDVRFDVCYCSPLSRARETAETVLEGRNVPIITDDRLAEMSFGIYEGIQDSFSIPDCPTNVLFFHPEQYITPVPEGESLAELIARTGEFLRDVALPLHKEGKAVLIVAHGGVNSSLWVQAKNIPIKDFWAEGIEQCKLKVLVE